MIRACAISVIRHYYIHMKKFGYSPYELELSHLIRKKLLSREIALKKLNDQPQAQIDYGFNELGLRP